MLEFSREIQKGLSFRGFKGWWDRRSKSADHGGVLGNRHHKTCSQ